MRGEARPRRIAGYAPTEPLLCVACGPIRASWGMQVEPRLGTTTHYQGQCVVCYSSAALRCEMSNQPKEPLIARGKGGALTWTLHCRRAKHTRERAKKRARERANEPKPNASAPAQSQTAQSKRSRARAAQTNLNDPRTKRATRRPRPGPVICQPNQGGREPRGKTTANNPLTAPMLPETKTSTRQTRRGKTGTGAPQAKKPRRRQGQHKDLRGALPPNTGGGWSPRREPDPWRRAGPLPPWPRPRRRAGPLPP